MVLSRSRYLATLPAGRSIGLERRGSPPQHCCIEYRCEFLSLTSVTVASGYCRDARRSPWRVARHDGRRKHAQCRPRGRHTQFTPSCRTVETGTSTPATCRTRRACWPQLLLKVRPMCWQCENPRAPSRTIWIYCGKRSPTTVGRSSSSKATKPLRVHGRIARSGAPGVVDHRLAG